MSARLSASWVSLPAGSAAACLGAVVAVGWLAGSPALVQLAPPHAPMQFNTAVCLLTLGMGVSGLALGLPRARWWVWAPVAAVAFLTIVEYASGVSLGIDRAHLTSNGFTATATPGRMSALTAIALMTGAGTVPLLSSPMSRRRSVAAAFVGSVPLAIGGFALLEYSLDASWQYAWKQAMQIAPHTAIACVLLGTSLVALAWARSERIGSRLPAWSPPWAAVLLAATTMGLTVAVRDRDAELLKEQSSATAADLALGIGIEVNGLRDAYEGMAARLSHPGQSAGAWHDDAALHIRHARDPYAAIYVLDRTMTPVAVEPGTSAELPTRARVLSARPMLAALVQAAAWRRGIASAPLDVAPGTTGFVIAAPIVKGDRLSGFVMATLAYEPLFERLLGGSPYCVRVLAAGVPIYTSPNWIADAIHGSARLDLDGGAWELEVAPGQELRGWQATSLPVAILAFGLVLSLAVGGLAALMRRVASQNLRAHDVNQHLEVEVHQRRQTEAQLGRALTFLHTVLDNTSYSVIGTDLDGVIRTFNRSAERMLGYTAAEVVGKLTPLVIHDQSEIAQRAVQLSIELERPVTPGFEIFVAAARRDEVDRREWTYIRKDGGRFPVELSITGIFDAEGRLTGFMGTAIDITSRRHTELLRRWAEDSLRRTEELLHSVLDASLNGVLAFKCVRDDDGAILDLECVLANPAAERLLGLPVGSLVGRTHHQVTGSDPSHHLFGIYTRVVDTGEPVDLEFQSRTFGSRWFRIVATPLGHDGVAVTFEDITRRKQLDAEVTTYISDLEKSRDRIHEQSVLLQWHADALTRARDEALAGAREMERALKIQADFVSFASHQLRTPLSGLRWLLELAGEEPGQTVQMRSYVADCLASTERLVHLVNDLLDVSRLEGGRATPVLADVDLAESCQEVVDGLRPNLERSSHTLISRGLGEPAGVLADPQLVRQVVANLLSNAIKYTPAGGHLSLAVERVGDEVRCAVEDDGIGVPEKARGQLFEKFFRADNVASLEAEGTGLGLYMVRLILHKFGGRIWFEAPRSGRGSRFVFALPAGGSQGARHAA